MARSGTDPSQWNKPSSTSQAAILRKLPSAQEQRSSTSKKPCVPNVVSSNLLRKASLVLAETGEILHRDEYSRLQVEPTELTALLAEPNTPHTPNQSGIFGLWRRLSEPTFRTNVMKCTLAYAIAALFTFSSLRTLIPAGPASSRHFAATVCVYFHPARTVGAMIQSVQFVVFMLLYSTTLACLGLGVSDFIRDSKLSKLVGRMILILLTSVGFGLIGLLKIRINHPAFRTACSVAVIFLVTVLVKEDILQRNKISFAEIQYYLSIVCAGISVSVLVCILIKPTSSTKIVKTKLSKVMDKYEVMLTIILNKFVLGESVECSEFAACEKEVQSLIKDARSHLSPAHLELFVQGRAQEYALLYEILQSHSRLLLHIVSLAQSSNILSKLLSLNLNHNLYESTCKRTPESASLLFHTFVENLGPPMNSFTTTLRAIMAHIPFDKNANLESNPISIVSLQRAIGLYQAYRERALDRIYSDKTYGPGNSFEVEPTDNDAVVATCGNFSYLLEELGEEVMGLLRLLEKFKHLPQKRSWQISWCQIFSRSQKQTFAQLAYTGNKRTQKSLGYYIWLVTRRLRSLEARCAIREGLGALVLLALALLPTTRQTFQDHKGEWSLIIYMIMMARNLGATTATLLQRFSGMFMGTVLAVLVWKVSRGMETVLWILTVLISTVCFVLIASIEKQALGRFILLTYNLVCLYGYAVVSRVDEDEYMHEILYIAIDRFVAVSAGVMWGIFVTLTLLPSSARKSLRIELSAQWLRLGIVWKSNLFTTLSRKNPIYSAPLSSVYHEEELQEVDMDLQALLTNAVNEFRLKGKFDPSPYKNLLESTNFILGAFHELGILISKSQSFSSKELILIDLTAPEVQEISASIFLFFYVAAASIRLGLAVPENVSFPEGAIKRMLRKLEEYRVSTIKQPSESVDKDDFVLFYSYILVTFTILESLDSIRDTLGELYGTLNEELFEYA